MALAGPIRRYSDLHNQHALFGSLPAGAAAPAAITALNERCTAISRYHAHTAAMARRRVACPLLEHGKPSPPWSVGTLQAALPPIRDLP
jgi:exoribonuclease R